MTSRPYTYKLQRFDEKSLRQTNARWIRQIERHPSEVLASQYERILRWSAERIDYGDATGEEFAYGLFRDGDATADAIVEVTYTKRGRKWLKLLDLHLSPELDLAFYDQSVDILRINDLFAAAVVGVVKLTGEEHPSQTAKLYARSGTLLAFFRSLGAYIQEQRKVDVLKVAIEGRWLVFHVATPK
jgi:hypothetical protein